MLSRPLFASSETVFLCLELSLKDAVWEVGALEVFRRSGFSYPDGCPQVFAFTNLGSLKMAFFCFTLSTERCRLGSRGPEKDLAALALHMRTDAPR